MQKMGKDDRQNLIVGPSPPVKRNGMSFVSAFWILVTFAVTAGLIVAGGFPYWLGNRVEGAPNSAQSLDLTGDLSYSALARVDLGLYHLCYQLHSDSPLMTCGADTACNGRCRDLRFCGCVDYLSYNPPSNFTTSDGLVRPSGVFAPRSAMDFVWLFAASIIYAVGVFLLLVSLIVGGVAFFKPRVKSCSLFLTAFVFQIIAGVFLIVSFFLIPVFFGSDFAKQFCGSQANYYQKGQCTIDWSLYMGMVVSACSLYLPAIAVFALNISDGIKAPVCC